MKKKTDIPFYLMLVTVLLINGGCASTKQTLLYTQKSSQGPWQIWKQYANGTGKQLTVQNGERPRWIPGTKTHFAYIESKPGNPNVKLWVAKEDGKNPLALTGFEIDSEYSWSPDGKWLAVAHTKDGNYEIYKIAVDGSQQVRLTTNTFTDRYPRWSPNGDKIAFVSTRNNDEDIFIINADGTGEKNLMPAPEGSGGWDRRPSWSWDGKKIVFEASRYPAGGGAAVQSISVVDVSSLQITKINDIIPTAAPLWYDKFVFYYSGHDLYRYDTSTGKVNYLGRHVSAFTHAPLTANAANVYITQGYSASTVRIFQIQHYTGNITDLGPGYEPDVW